MGGTVDPKTGQVIWDMNLGLEQQLAFYNTHPPRCLDDLTCTRIEVPDFTFDGHGEPVNAVFELTCSCGSKLFAVLAHCDDGEFVSPVYLKCDACDVTR